jgi:medium-chain acyl-[acyl-carrier-protein] hydrolase
VDDIDNLLRRTRVLLAPSLWAEARSRIVVEAMLRGVPVMAADVGGIPEAKMGIPYLLPVNPIAKYRPEVDEQMVPVAEVPPQDIGPWREALARLLGDRAHYEEIARASRRAALEYAAGLSAEPFERLLVEAKSARPLTLAVPRETAGSGAGALSPEKRRLLAIRLRQRAPSAAWFPGADAAPAPRLFWFPHAGGGTVQPRSIDPRYIGVRLPGRESRIMEAPFERMEQLVEALAKAIEPYTGEPFRFFGHSMGAAVAFELARALRRRGLPLPRILIASAARAPQFRRNHAPQPPASDRELLESLDIPAEPLARRQGACAKQPRSRDTVDVESSLTEELAQAFLPALRADTTLYRSYVYAEEPPLDCPIRAYGGTEDPHIRDEHLEGWGFQTTASFAVRRFAGGHFYLRESAEAFRAVLEADLA